MQGAEFVEVSFWVKQIFSILVWFCLDVVWLWFGCNNRTMAPWWQMCCRKEKRDILTSHHTISSYNQRRAFDRAHVRVSIHAYHTYKPSRITERQPHADQKRLTSSIESVKSTMKVNSCALISAASGVRHDSMYGLGVWCGVVWCGVV